MPGDIAPLEIRTADASVNTYTRMKQADVARTTKIGVLAAEGLENTVIAARLDVAMGRGGFGEPMS
jgi:hypothetical protein